MRTDEAMAVEDLHGTLRAKIESDAKVIAALRERLATIEAQAIASTEPDYVAVPARLVYEQNVGK